MARIWSFEICARLYVSGVSSRHKYFSFQAQVFLFPKSARKLLHECFFFFFFFTFVTGPRGSLRLKLSDTRVYEPQIRARLGTTAISVKWLFLNTNTSGLGLRKPPPPLPGSDLCISTPGFTVRGLGIRVEGLGFEV